MGPGRYSGLEIALFALPFCAGPLLAGLTRAPIAVVPVFAALFLGYLAAVGRVSLSAASASVFLLTALMQIILVSAAYGLGALLAIPLPPVTLPLWVPLGLILCAAIWGGRRFCDTGETDAMLDEVIETLDAADLELGPPDDDLLVARLDAPSEDGITDTANAILRDDRMQAAAVTALMRTHDSSAATRQALSLMADPRFPTGLMNFFVIDNILEEINATQDRELALLAVAMQKNLGYPEAEPFRDNLYQVAGIDPL